MSSSLENKSLTKLGIIGVVVLLMLSSAWLLNYLSGLQADVPKPIYPKKTNMKYYETKQKEFEQLDSTQPKKVTVILKVTPKDTSFKLSMIKPEKVILAESEKEEVQLLMDEGLLYQLKLQTNSGQEEYVKIQPSGQMEVHYIRF